MQSKAGSVLVSILAVAALGAGSAFAAMSDVKVAVDFKREQGIVKPVNGVGQPPMIGVFSERPQLFPYLQAAGIPYSRLHDVGGWMGQGIYVDIPNIFPNFDADENDPKNYYFEATDRLIANLNKFGVEAFYRLGVTIENWTGDGMKGLRCLPPKDYAKWARICEHVIRHYNEGWADGYRFNLKYWEIWNEPENNPDLKMNPMWQAPFEEYIKFYGVAATHLKAKFPNLKIGGYGSCGFYAIGKDLAMFANSSPQTVYFVDCAKQFLKAVKANNWPLDFFSFHSYSDPKPAIAQVRYADKFLTENGFPREKCERIYNEWLPYAGQTMLGTAQQAVGIAAELIELQNGPCDVACLYDARCGIGAYSPLFNPLTLTPHKAYYAFTAFNELRKCGTAVAAKATGDEDLHVAAAVGKDGSAVVMIANDSDHRMRLACDFGGRQVVSYTLTDRYRTNDTFPGMFPEVLHAWGILTVHLK